MAEEQKYQELQELLNQSELDLDRWLEMQENMDAENALLETDVENLGFPGGFSSLEEIQDYAQLYNDVTSAGDILKEHYGKGA
jgi:hypothetical protein